MEAPALARRRAEWELGGRRRHEGKPVFVFLLRVRLGATAYEGRPGRGGRWLGGGLALAKQEEYSINAHDELVETRTKLR